MDNVPWHNLLLLEHAVNLRLFTEIIKEVVRSVKGSDWKVLVVDQQSMRMISACCTMTELLAERITREMMMMILYLRHPSIFSSFTYRQLSRTSENVANLFHLWKPCISSLHLKRLEIFFLFMNLFITTATKGPMTIKCTLCHFFYSYCKKLFFLFLENSDKFAAYQKNWNLWWHFSRPKI